MQNKSQTIEHLIKSARNKNNLPPKIYQQYTAFWVLFVTCVSAYVIFFQ